MPSIYALECANHKYYVGKTTLENVEDIGILLEHLSPLNSCAFTRLHKPVRVVEVINTNDPVLENITTKKYMLQYGIENVRGGSYTNLKLLDWQVQALEAEFENLNAVCTLCKLDGHLEKDCQFKEYLDNITSIEGLDNEIANVQNIHNNQLCWTLVRDLTADVKREFIPICDEYDKLSLQFTFLLNKESYCRQNGERDKISRKMNMLKFEPVNKTSNTNDVSDYIYGPNFLVPIYNKLPELEKQYSINLTSQSFNLT